MVVNSDEYSFEDDNILNIFNAIKNNAISANIDLDEDSKASLDEEFENYIDDIEKPKKKRGRKPKNASSETNAEEDFSNVQLFIPASCKNNARTTAVINYLKTNPNPEFKSLTVEDEIEILNKWLKKDKQHLEYLLFCHHVRLVYAIAGKYFKKTNEFDDMVSRGYEGLMWAIKNFDFTRALNSKSKKKIKFSTYATFWIKKYVIWEFYKDSLNVSQKNVSIDKSVSDGDEESESNSASLENYLAAHLNTSIYRNTIKPIDYQISCNFANELIGNIYDFIETNPNRNFEKYDSEIFYRIFNENDTIKEISADMNLSVSYVNKRKSDIIKKIRDMLAEKYGITSIHDIF